MPADPRRVEEVWLAASAVAAEERDRFLADECGSDAPLRRRVEELLRSATTAAAERMFEDDLETLLGGTTVPLSFGRYQLRGPLGRGGMGEVYEAWDPTLARPVAVKTLPELRAASDDARARFRKEIEFLGRLSHPNVVAVFDADLDAERPFVVMEKLTGRTLAEVVRERGPLPAAEALKLIRLAAEGLAAIHAAGVIHRDVKPDNLFLVGEPGDPYDVKLLDFGFAKVRESKTTAAGFTMGTPEYMAPEQALSDTVDARTDIYSLGAVAYRALTGELPFGADDDAELLARVVLDTPVPPLNKDPSLDPRIAAIITTAMRKHPENRYSTMRVMKNDMEVVRAGEGGVLAESKVLRDPDVYEPQGPIAQGAVTYFKKLLARKAAAAAL
jgi:serine/threonine protein kinase